MVGKTLLLGDEDVIVLTLTSAVVKDTPVFVAGIGVLLPQSSADANVAVAYRTCGIVKVVVAESVAVAVGNNVFFDVTAGKAVLDRPTTGFYLGAAVSAGTGTAGGTVGVDVIINKVSDGQGNFQNANLYAANVLEQKVVAGLSDAAVTLTAAQVKGGIITQTPSTGRNITLPAASALLALVPYAVVGSAVEITIKNLASATHAMTVVASSSITNGGIAGDFTVAATANATFWIVFTNVTAGTVAAVAYRK